MTEVCRFGAGSVHCLNGPECPNVNHRGPRVLESMPDDAGGLAVVLTTRLGACPKCCRPMPVNHPTIDGECRWCWQKTLADLAPTGTG